MIDVIIEDEGWSDLLGQPQDLAGACYGAANAVEPAINGEIALLLTNDTTIQALNARFRDNDKPTNVLSFPSADNDEFIGDIALALETCVTEAEENEIALRDHTAHLIIHGMLHLVGYDHHSDLDAEKMERREIDILKRLDIADPYADLTEKRP